MGGYWGRQFGLRFPEKTSAIVAVSVGLALIPAQRDAWLRETLVLAHIFCERGMNTMADRMARSPARIQLRYKDPIGLARISCPAAPAVAIGHVEYDGALSSLAAVSARSARSAFEDDSSSIARRGRSGCPLLGAQLMLESALPNAGLWICPNTGHAINLEEPAAFNAQVEGFLSVCPGRS